MKIEVQAGLITAGIIVAAGSLATLIVFIPEVIASIAVGVIASVIVYHLYKSVLHDLRARDWE